MSQTAGHPKIHQQVSNLCVRQPVKADTPLITEAGTASPHPHCNARFLWAPAIIDGAVLLPEPM